MDFTPWGWGPMHLIGTIVYGVFCLLVLFVTVALIFLLVRYLLVATKAAQLQVAHLESLQGDPAVDTPPTAPAPPFTAPTSPGAATASGATTAPPAATVADPVAPTSDARSAPTASAPSEPVTESKPASKPRSVKKPPTEPSGE